MSIFSIFQKSQIFWYIFCSFLDLLDPSPDLNVEQSTDFDFISSTFIGTFCKIIFKSIKC